MFKIPQSIASTARTLSDARAQRVLELQAALREESYRPSSRQIADALFTYLRKQTNQ